jgi:hypothetical protein
VTAERHLLPVEKLRSHNERHDADRAVRGSDGCGIVDAENLPQEEKRVEGNEQRHSHRGHDGRGDLGEDECVPAILRKIVIDRSAHK